jgi:hypothetical protein
VNAEQVTKAPRFWVSRKPLFFFLSALALVASGVTAFLVLGIGRGESDKDQRVAKGGNTEDVQPAKGDWPDGGDWPGMWLFGRTEGTMIHVSSDGHRESGVGSLIYNLRNEDAGIRESAAGWLGAIGPDAKDAVPGLKQALEDPDAEVREAAAAALEKIEEI